MEKRYIAVTRANCILSTGTYFCEFVCVGRLPLNTPADYSPCLAGGVFIPRVTRCISYPVGDFAILHLHSVCQTTRKKERGSWFFWFSSPESNRAARTRSQYKLIAVQARKDCWERINAKHTHTHTERGSGAILLVIRSHHYLVPWARRSTASINRVTENSRKYQARVCKLLPLCTPFFFPGKSTLLVYSMCLGDSFRVDDFLPPTHCVCYVLFHRYWLQKTYFEPFHFGC